MRLSSLSILTHTPPTSTHHRLQNNVLTADSVEALKGSVITLTDTLKHIEAVSKDFSDVTGDQAVKTNLKQLIESLSRLISE